ncbi:MAG: bifunctional riboflavin kinase/FAD synthetase [Phormidesmis sp.]
MWITSSLNAAKTPTNIALGNFDGVHLGHQQVMAQVLADRSPFAQGFELFTAASIAALHSGTSTAGYSHLSARAYPDVAEYLPESTGMPPTVQATVVTFSPHPQEYFSGMPKLLLTPIAEKTWQLAQMGIQQLVMLPFNLALAELSPEEFVAQILIKGLKAEQISVGSDFRFGKDRRGNAEVLETIAARYGVPVMQVPLKHEKGDRISSSRIRQALQSGDLEVATRLLGRPYTLTGRVVQGQQLGRTIGFPTANLRLPADKYLPRTGVYSVRVYGVGTEPLQGVMNIGNRPTVDGQALSIEIHLLNWSGDLYGQVLTVSLEGFVRAEQKFDSLERLKAQIAADCSVAISTLS